MPAIIQYEPNNLCVLRISGLLKRAEFGEGQNALAREIDGGAQPRVLAVVEKFEGFERGADWNDLDFMLSHGNEIARIAIVGEPRWETDFVAFAGAGFRRAPVKFFPSGQESAARAWLEE